jgi:hypothetical protein
MRISRLIPVALLSPLLVGCVTTYVKRVDDVPPEDARPATTLMGSMIVAVEASQDGSVDGGGSIVDLFQNASLDEFGVQAQPKLAAELKRRGFELVKDKDVASTLDFFAVTKGNQAMTTLTGHWVHPEGSDVDPDVFHYVYLFTEDKGAEIARKLDALEGAKDKDFFAFTGVKIMTPSGFGCGGLWCWAEPRVRVNFIVVDRKGKTVYDAQGVGNGKGAMFIVDRSPSNLSTAVDQAINALQATEAEPLPY